MIVRNIRIILAVVLCLGLSQMASAKILFQDDFEAEKMGDEPSKWDYDPGAEEPIIAQIVEDPVEGDKCLSNLGGYVVKDSSEWTDYVVEFDWLYAVAGENESVAFRYQDASNFYQLSKRGDDQSIIIYMYNGAWNQIATGVFPVSVNVWYRTQLKVKGANFVVKMKPKTEPVAFADIDPIIDVDDNTFAKGGFSTAYNGPIDDVIIAESEADILSVEPASKLSSTWGALKL